MTSFEQIYREHFRFVWRVLRQLGVAEADAADAAQDVFVVAHRKLAEFEGRSKVTTWLYGISARVASHRRRSARSRPEVPSADPGATERAESDDPAVAAEKREAFTVLEWILGRMPVEQCAVFTAFEIEGMASDEIAAALEIPVGTVHSRLRLARECFRKELARLDAKERFRLGEGDRP